MAVVLLFLLSGGTGVVFEVLWIRIFTSILGSSTQSVGAVVTAFMLGIGLGQRWFGRRADAPGNLLRLYGLLELGVAASSLLAYWLFLGLDGVYRAAHLALPGEAVKWGVFAVAFALISLPAALIGGSLPVLVTAALRGGAEAREGLGRLYGANTLGAAGGALGSVVVVSRVGYDVGYHLALAASLGTAALALWLARAQVAPEVARPVEGLPDGEAVAPRWLAAGFALSGFAALGSEVLWQRLLEFYFQGTLISFALILAVYLLGIGFGSLLTRRWRATVRQFALLELGVGLLALGAVPLVTWVAEAGRKGAAIGVFLGVVLVSTFLLGAIFPLVGRLYLAGATAAGRAAGDITSANTLGAVAGSVGVSFGLLPLLGTRGTLLLLGLTSLALGVGFARGRWRAAAAALGLAAVGLWLQSDWVTRYYLAAFGRPGFTLRAERESSLQPVLVLEDEAGRRVLMGGAFQSGEIDEVRRQTQRLQAHLPMLLHPAPRRVLEVGYGVGEIPRTLLRYAPERLDLVELDPKMMAMADAHFGALNGRASEDPRVRTRVMDGRQYLRTTDETWDVVMTDSMIPVSELSLRMYALEHFQAGRAHLAPGGVMVLWLPLNVGAERVRVMLRTFLEVFPQSLLWLPQAHAADEAFAVGFRDAPALDGARVAERFAAVARDDLAPFGWTSPATYLASFRLGPAELRALVQGVEGLHRDRAPVLDFLPVREGQGMVELLDAVDAASRPVALEFLPEGSPLRAGVQAAFDADLAFRRTPRTEAALGAFLARHPGHPAATLALAEALAGRDPERAAALDPYNVEALVALLRRADDPAQRAGLAARLRAQQPYHPALGSADR